MVKKILALVLESSVQSFIQVTVFVGFALLLFGYLDYKQQGALVERIGKSKKLQPLIGAILGIFPGCGGSILLMPLYVKGTVTFGTVIATTIATAGDSAFVTLTPAPKEFLIITSLSFLIGTAAGYLVDALHIGDKIKSKISQASLKNLTEKHRKLEADLDELYGDNQDLPRSSNLKHIGHEEGDMIDIILHHKKPFNPNRVGYKITHGFYLVFWLLIALGFILGVLDLLPLAINESPIMEKLNMIIGVLGTLFILLYMLCSRRFLQGQSHEDTEHKLYSLKETFIHNAKETSFVASWVLAAYLAYEFAVLLIGGEQVLVQVLTASGLLAVLIGAAIGIIPGCGPQIIFVSMYLKGMFPFSALLANAISQDGDALFPLIALDRKAALWTTLINTIFALVFGLLAYALEARFFF